MFMLQVLTCMSLNRLTHSLNLNQLLILCRDRVGSEVHVFAKVFEYCLGGAKPTHRIAILISSDASSRLINHQYFCIIITIQADTLLLLQILTCVSLNRLTLSLNLNQLLILCRERVGSEVHVFLKVSEYCLGEEEQLTVLEYLNTMRHVFLNCHLNTT